MKSRRNDFNVEIPETSHVGYAGTGGTSCRALRQTEWRSVRHKEGSRKDQRTLTIQITKTIERRIGIHMTPTSSGISLGIHISRKIPRTTETPADVGTRLGQDHPNLCGLVEPARQPGL